MTLRQTLHAAGAALALVLAACAPGAAGGPTASAPESGAPPSVSAPTPAAAAHTTEPVSGKDPRNATYRIDGQPITLLDGKAEQEAAPGSAERVRTVYFGNEVTLDLNGDGLLDTAFLLTHSTGGTGTFYLVAAALRNADGSYSGTDTVFLGDRIAPQSSGVDPTNPARFIVNYADRQPGEPMIAQPSVGVSRTFALVDGSMVDVGE